MTVAENYILDSYHRPPYSKHGVFDLAAVAERATAGVKDFDIRTPSIETRAGRCRVATSRRSSSRVSSRCRSSS